MNNFLPQSSWSAKKKIVSLTAVIIGAGLLAGGGYATVRQAVILNSGEFEATNSIMQADELQQTMLMVKGSDTGGQWRQEVTLDFAGANKVHTGWFVTKVLALRAVKTTRPDSPEPAPKAVTKASLKITQMGQETALNDKIRAFIYFPNRQSEKSALVHDTIDRSIDTYKPGKDIEPIYIKNNTKNIKNIDDLVENVDSNNFDPDYLYITLLAVGDFSAGGKSSPLRVEITPTELEKEQTPQG